MIFKEKRAIVLNHRKVVPGIYWVENLEDNPKSISGIVSIIDMFDRYKKREGKIELRCFSFEIYNISKYIINSISEEHNIDFIDALYLWLVAEIKKQNEPLISISTDNIKYITSKDMSFDNENQIIEYLNRKGINTEDVNIHLVNRILRVKDSYVGDDYHGKTLKSRRYFLTKEEREADDMDQLEDHINQKIAQY